MNYEGNEAYLEKVEESQEYLRQVADAIKRGLLTINEANNASITLLSSYGDKIFQAIPFPCYIKPDVEIIENAETAGIGISLGKLLRPYYSIIPASIIDTIHHNSETRSKKRNEIAEMPYHEKLFRVSDAARCVFPEEERVLIDGVFQNVPFFTLYWENKGIAPTYATPVGKMNQVIPPTISLKRLTTLRKLRNTAQIIGADIMQENGIIF